MSFCLTHPLQERVLAMQKVLYTPTRSCRNLREDGWFIARHVMEVTIFKDYRRLFKYIEEIHGRTDDEV